MAYPFGGFPQLAEYLQWAASQGCKVESGVILDDEGRPFGTIRITAKDKSIVILGDQDMRVGPLTISRYDRRLGLTSPFFSWDEEPLSGPSKKK
jgi:hypothetical protein